MQGKDFPELRLRAVIDTNGLISALLTPGRTPEDAEEI